MSRLLIIGGSDAGISAGLRARQLDASSTVTIVLADSFPNYSICGLPFYISGETPDWHDLAHRTRQDIDAQGLQLLLDHRAVKIDAVAKSVDLVDQQDRRQQLSYDKLVIGTGAEPAKPAIDGP
jgi:NADPH-dependent 2,4-dienoyl-CoA reductase/sulfur reductase-like enzyme